MMTGEYGRYGKAHGAGFYEYPEDGKKHLWPRLQTVFPPQGESLCQAEMIERLMFVQALETVRCLEENVVTSVTDANIGSIFGWGFAPFKGGTLQYINDYGLVDFIARSEALAEKYGKRFTPPEMLLAMRDAKRTF
jgi:3-hydroxyacyl-CoA dehydrogenase/enoyl-CoA hydratase/3-hydroxybutyryl-CoA epimerase